ncbi:MAG: zinc-dependent metalloprotease [Acidimicrobiia bacterium]|nr:zinc-dependent metalloprotease [Acidimicrobiia bacterium]MDH4308592.1 zinc-dependent metalloprotease [Acidimicrobiia bacterium]MDH5292046.1 zinc-dependent metalloprotease [Acidimicrobiia bacterium]
MSDDLFSKLFELFNQPGPVNLKLASEICHHMTGEKTPVDPWAAEEFRELTRLAEFQIEQVTPFPVAPAPDVLPVDAREWADRNLEGLQYLAEPFSGIIDTAALGPAAAMMGQLGPAMIGMQLGTLVGSLATWAMAGFDAGVPVTGNGPITFAVPTIERFTTEHGFDARDVRLWAALHETAHRAIFRVPFTSEHLVELLTVAASHLKISPDKLTDLMEGLDPTSMASGLDPDRIAGLFDSPEAAEAQRELDSYLGLVGGYRRLIVERAASHLLPRMAEMDAARDAERDLGDAFSGSPFSATFADPTSIARGREFCLELTERFGEESLALMWTRPGRFPTAAEIDDPVAYAARVLLEDM